MPLLVNLDGEAAEGLRAFHFSRAASVRPYWGSTMPDVDIIEASPRMRAEIWPLAWLLAACVAGSICGFAVAGNWYWFT